MKIFLLFITIITTALSQFTLVYVPNIGKALTSYQTLAPGVTYDLNFTMNKMITTGSTVTLTFASQFKIPNSSLANCRASRVAATTPVTATCISSFASGLAVYSIIFSGLYTTSTTQNFLRLMFDITNPWGATGNRIDVYIKDSSSITLDSTTFTLTYTASSLNSCSFTGTSVITGNQVSHIVKFTPSKDLIASSYLVVTMPPWFIGELSNLTSTDNPSVSCTGLQNTDFASLGCSLDVNYNSLQILTITDFVSANKTSPGQIIIQVDTLKNPWSTQPFGEIIFEIYFTGSGPTVTQKCIGVYETATTPNQFMAFNMNLTSTQISTVNNGIQLILVVTNPNPKNMTRLRIEYSSEITVVYTGSDATVESQNSTQMIFTNIAPNQRTSGSSLILSGFTITTPPSTRPFTIKFTTEYYPALNTVYEIDTLSQTYQNNPGVITGGLATPTDPTINVVTSYKIEFALKNSMKNGGFIQIIFPSTLAIDLTATCTVNITNVSLCAIASSNVTININGTVPSLTAFTVTVNKVKNAGQSIVSGTFKIYSYYDSLFNSLIDNVESGITVTMIANQITVASVTPTNKTTYVVTSYKFDFTLQDSIPQNGYIELEFPSTVVPLVGSISIVASSFSSSTCSLSPTGQIIRINNCFTAGPMSTLATSITIGGIQNPPSYQPSSTFKIRTYSNLPSLLNSISSGITTQMDTAYVLSTFSVTPFLSIVHTDTKQTINIVHAIPLNIGDYLLINIDPTMVISASVNCGAISGVSTIGCLRINNTQLRVTYTAGISAQTVKYDVTSVMNYDVAQTAVPFDVTVYASDDFIKEKATTTFTYTEASITTFTVNNDDKITLLDYSQITLTLSTPFTLGSSFNPTLTMLEILMPTGIPTDATTTCSVLSGSCTIPLNTKVQITGVGLSLTSYSIVLTKIMLPLISVQSSSFTMTFYYNGKKVSTVSSGVVIRPYCTSPCKACIGSPTRCINCLPAPNLLIYFDQVGQTCLASCLSGTYPDSNKICQNCVQPCVTCETNLDCLSCISNTWLHNKRCVNPCPLTFYNGANGSCIACDPPCNTCRAQFECLSCTTGFFYNYTCVAANLCPSGTYANITTLNCQPCHSPCSACLNTQSNCTACTAPFLYYDNICGNSCPSNMYQSGSSCLNCTGLCSTCQNATYCLSCSANYYSNGSCVLASNCPANTFSDSGDMSCKTCPAGCTGCISLSNCSSCDTAFYVFYQYQCLASCPNGTYRAGFTCQPCALTCQNCQNTSSSCLSCNPGTYLYINTCPISCPRGFYEDVNVCKSCKPQCADCTTGSSCTQCSGSLFLTLSGQCLNTCPAGFYKNAINNKCDPCSSPCNQCDSQPTNCTSCISSRVLYQNDCSSASCPSQFFNVSGQCKTCSNCDNCLSADRCDHCRAGYFLYAGFCFTDCPATAPIQDILAQSCTVCDATCLMCAVTTKNCTSCNAGTYLFNYGCFDSCPSGYVEKAFTRTCEPKQLSSIFFFPTMFTFLALVVIMLYGKFMYRQTQFVTILTAVVSVCCFVSWIIYFMVMYFFEASLDSQIVTLFSIIAIAIVGLSVVLGVGYQVYLRCAFDCDSGYSCWIQHDSLNSRIHKAIIAGSLPTFIFYRFIYSRLFHRQYFSLCYADGQRILTNTHRLALLTIFFQLLPMVGISFYTIYKKQLYDQTVYSSLDTLAINVILIILLLIEGSKSGEEYFAEMRKKLPFIVTETKGKYLEVDSSMSVMDLDDYQIQKQKRIKTEIPQKDRDSFFRRITCIENLNKFGHLNEFTPKEEDRTKSLPQQKDLKNYPQFSLEQDQIEVIDDLFFQQKQEEQYRRQQQRLEQQRRQQEEIQREKQREEQRKRKEIQKRKQDQQERIQRQKREKQEKDQQDRLAKLLQDQLEQENLECVDIVAIDKVESKNKQKKSPLDFLSKCKTVDSKPIDQKATKKLQDMAKKNGIDPEFMKETFGVQKHHNQDLLNAIIDKHNHVSRQAVKEMFKQTNNKQVLQQLFSKNSTVDTDKLKALMNDKEGVQMIEKLMDQEKGIVSADVAKALLDKNSKFKPEFTKKLLSGESGADEKKLQQLLRNGEDEKTNQQNLKALKKIGGQNLQNKQIIESMLGQNSNLDPTQFSKVASNLSAKALQSIFTNKSPQNLQLVDKVLNNKKINLRAVSPIFEDDQLIYELGKKLGSEDPVLEENIMNLLKNCGQNTDPEKLKEFLQNQVLVKKLMQNSIIDPQFLTEILSKDSKASLDLIEKTIESMAQEDIQRVFEFTGDKNIDYKSISKIFEQNGKTDPQLVKKMLDPELVEEVFTKNNNVNANMLQKLVQKGSKFDKDNIVSIYGKNTNNPFDNPDGFEKQGRMTNRTKKNTKPPTLQQSITENVKSGPFSELMRNLSFSQMVNDGSLSEMVKNGSNQEILQNSKIQSMLKDGSFAELMKNASNGQIIKTGKNGQTIKFGQNGQITKTGPSGQSITVNKNGDTVIQGLNGQTMKIGKNGEITILKANGQVLKSGSYEQLMVDGILEDMINDGTFGDMVKNGPIGESVRNGTFGNALQNGSLTEIIKKQACQEVIKNGAFAQVLKNGPLFQNPHRNMLGSKLSKQEESIIQSIRNGPFTELMKNPSFSELMKDGSLTEMLKNGSREDILQNQKIQQMFKDGSFGQIMKRASNGQMIKSGDNGEMVKFGSNGEITKIGPKGESISLDSNGDTIMIGSNGQTIKIGQSGTITIIGANGQILKNGSYEQVMKDGLMKEMIQNGTFGDMTKNCPIGQMIRNGTFGDTLKKGSLAEIIKNETYNEVVKNGAFIDLLKNGPIGQIIMNEDVQQSIKNGKFQSMAKNGSFNQIFCNGPLATMMKNDGGGTFYDPQNNQTQYDFKMAFNRTANQNFNMSENGQVRPQQMEEMIMSRTDGGIMGFLNPLKLKEKKKKLKESIKIKDQWDELGERLQNLDEDSDEQDGFGNDKAILEQDEDEGFAQNRRRKPPVKKRKLKKITDIRHPAEKIYLEPILAPHQIQQKKSFRKKKRDHTNSATKLIMDEDNDVFDIDF